MVSDALDGISNSHPQTLAALRFLTPELVSLAKNIEQKARSLKFAESENLRIQSAAEKSISELTAVVQYMHHFVQSIVTSMGEHGTAAIMSRPQETPPSVEYHLFSEIRSALSSLESRIDAVQTTHRTSSATCERYVSAVVSVLEANAKLQDWGTAATLNDTKDELKQSQAVEDGVKFSLLSLVTSASYMCNAAESQKKKVMDLEFKHVEQENQHKEDIEEIKKNMQDIISKERALIRAEATKRVEAETAAKQILNETVQQKQEEKNHSENTLVENHRKELQTLNEKIQVLQEEKEESENKLKALEEEKEKILNAHASEIEALNEKSRVRAQTAADVERDKMEAEWDVKLREVEGQWEGKLSKAQKEAEKWQKRYHRANG